MILTDKNLAIRFGGDNLGMSVRRTWEHVLFRQINPFHKSPFGRECQVDEFIDIIEMPERMNTLTGFTLADLRRRTTDLQDSQVEGLFLNLGRPLAQRWLRSVKAFLSASRKRRAMRNVPSEFLPYEAGHPLGISGLHLPLTTWLQENAEYKAPANQWAGRIKNLAQKGLRANELEHSGFAEFFEQSDSEAVNGSQIATNLTYDGLHLSVLPLLQRAGFHTHFISLSADAEIKRIKPKLRRKQSSSPQFYDQVLGYWIDIMEWDDLLGKQRGWIALTHRGELITSPSYPSGLCKVPDDAMKLADEHASQIMPRMSSHGKWSRDRLTGGENYREWLVTLPKYKPSYLSPHFDLRNILFHVRSDIREDYHSNRVLLLQEVQSDWADAAHRSHREGDNYPDRVPDPPWLKEWPVLAVKLMLLHAARSGLAGLAWTQASVHIKRWEASNMKPLLELYNQTLPNALNEALRPYQKRCGRIDVYVPVNYRIDPTNSGYVVSGAGDEELRTAATQREAQKLIPDGAQDQLTRMHGVKLDKDLRRDILENGFPAWGSGIQQH